jgi:hypothetical protein
VLDHGCRSQLAGFVALAHSVVVFLDAGEALVQVTFQPTRLRVELREALVENFLVGPFVVGSPVVTVQVSVISVSGRMLEVSEGIEGPKQPDQELATVPGEVIIGDHVEFLVVIHLNQPLVSEFRTNTEAAQALGSPAVVWSLDHVLDVSNILRNKLFELLFPGPVLLVSLLVVKAGGRLGLDRSTDDVMRRGHFIEASSEHRGSGTVQLVYILQISVHPVDDSYLADCFGSFHR